MCQWCVCQPFVNSNLFLGSHARNCPNLLSNLVTSWAGPRSNTGCTLLLACLVVSCLSERSTVVAAQRPAAGGEARTEAGSGAAQTGAAQGGGDGPTTALRPGDGAPKEAAEATRGQELRDCRDVIPQTIYLHRNTQNVFYLLKL